MQSRDEENVIELPVAAASDNLTVIGMSVISPNFNKPDYLTLGSRMVTSCAGETPTILNCPDMSLLPVFFTLKIRVKI